MIVGIHHIAIGVPDFERGLEFYRDVLGFEVVQRTEFDGERPMVDRAIGLEAVTAKMVMLKAPNAHIELWEYSNPEPEERRSRPCDFGYPHFALQVEGITEEYERLSAAGMKFVGPPVDFGESSAVYGEDPFGNVIEIYEIRSPDISSIG
jgi:glyoxylase I family protein